jgi:hypothetical protein
MAKKSEDGDKRFAFRITDKGAIEAVTQTMNALIHISVTVSMNRMESVSELIDHLKNQLKNTSNGSTEFQTERFTNMELRAKS